MRLSTHLEGWEGLVGEPARQPLAGWLGPPLVVAVSPYVRTRQTAASPDCSPPGWSPSAQEVLAR